VFVPFSATLLKVTLSNVKEAGIDAFHTRYAKVVPLSFSDVSMATQQRPLDSEYEEEGSSVVVFAEAVGMTVVVDVTVSVF